VLSKVLILTTASIDALHIEDNVFEGCTLLQEVTIQNDKTELVSIGKEVFKGCTSLVTITIPDSVTSLDPDTFSYSSLKGIVVAEGNSHYASDESGVLYDIYYESQKTLFRFPPGKPDQSYTIADDVKKVGDYAFRGCSVQTLNIPESVTSFSAKALVECAALTTITVADTNEHYSAEDGVLFDKEKSTLIRYPMAKVNNEKTYTIPAEVETVEEYAFEGRSDLTTLNIQAKLATINDNSLDGCVGLTTITVAPENTHFVASNVALLYTWYSGDSHVVKYPAKHVGTEYTFAHPEGVTITSVDAKAFEGCSSLTTITIPSTVTSIGSLAFKDCTGLSTITIPKSVTTLQTDAFEGCTGLSAFTVEEGSNTCKSDDGVLICGSILAKYPAKKAGEHYKIPVYEQNPIDTIAKHAFEGCDNLVSVFIQEHIIGEASIKQEAFKDCPRLVSVEYNATYNPGFVDSFENCPGVQKVCVPEDYKTRSKYITETSFCGKEVYFCHKPVPPSPPTASSSHSSSATVVLPSLAAVAAAIFAIFF